MFLTGGRCTRLARDSRPWGDVRTEEEALSLVCRLDGRLCALPLAQVVETMRPMRVEPVAGAPSFLRGVAIIRGAPMPVVDAAALVTGAALVSGAAPPGHAANTARFVTLRVDGRAAGRCVALAVDEVVGVRSLPAGSARDLPPLLRGGQAESISSLGALDSELLVVLESARLLPEAVWRSLAGEEGAP